jgi:hypothetical protein
VSSPKRSTDPKVDVKISKETGGAYADVRQVIESELARIRQEKADNDAQDGSIRDIDNRNANRAQ